MKDLKDMTEKELVVLQRQTTDMIQEMTAKKVSSVKDSVITRLKKKLKRFVDIHWQDAVGHVQVSVKMPVYLSYDNDVFYFTYDINNSPSFRTLEDNANFAVENNVPLNKKMENTQKDLDAFLADMKNVAKEHEMEEDLLWEIVDPDGNWH